MFILNASRRLFSDRFFTSSFRPEFYTHLGVDWVNNNGPDRRMEKGKPNGHEMEVSPLKRVLLRTMPELAPELDPVVNAFDPWARDRGEYYSLQWKPRRARNRTPRSRTRAKATPMWTVRKTVWDRLAVLKFRANKPVRIPLPQDSARTVKAVSLASKFPRIPVDNVLIGDHVPDDEASTVKSRFFDLQVGLYGGLSPDGGRIGLHRRGSAEGPGRGVHGGAP